MKVILKSVHTNAVWINEGVENVEKATVIGQVVFDSEFKMDFAEPLLSEEIEYLKDSLRDVAARVKARVLNAITGAQGYNSLSANKGFIDKESEMKYEISELEKHRMTSLINDCLKERGNETAIALFSLLIVESTDSLTGEDANLINHLVKNIVTKGLEKGILI